MKKASMFGLVALFAVQLAVLAAMIGGRERILRDGEPYRFKTRPIDPADPFHGRYVWLGFESDFIPSPHGPADGLRLNQPLYARLAVDGEGFATFTGWSLERPADGAYLKTRYRGMRSDWNPETRQSTVKGLRIDLPFDRFYMDEAKAPRAEQAARDATRATNCWAVVRVLNGRTAIEDVYACGQSLRALAAARRGGP